MTNEPSTVYPEREFQKELVELISVLLTRKAVQHVIVERFGLDVGVFLGTPSSTRLRLFEVKTYGAQRSGGVGFGNREGVGPQVDLLLCEESRLWLFDSSVRWAYADATQEPGTCRYGLLGCASIKRAAMGNAVTRGKQNNIRVSALRSSLVDWSRFTEQVGAFLLPAD